MGGSDEQKRRLLWDGAAALAVLGLAALGALVVGDLVYPAHIGVRQPIPFSHRVHVQAKKISCLMCHTGVATSARAGIPPLQTCLLCHQRIIRNYPYIVQLREHFRRRQPILWQRVNWVPEFVYFDHSMHINKGIDCSTCHGDVARMDRVVKAREFKMGFCIECHRDNHATHDCFTCHR